MPCLSLDAASCGGLQAIQAWRDSSDFGRVQLVKQYFQCVEGFTVPEVVREVALQKGSSGGAGLFGGLFSSLPKLLSPPGQDPFVAVVAYRDFVPDSAGNQAQTRNPV